VTLHCPACGLAFDGGGLGGRVFCPSCGAPFQADGGAGVGESAPIWREAAYTERPRTCPLAVASLICGLAALVPGCLCLPGFMFFAVSAPRVASSAPPPMPVRVAPAVPVPSTVPVPVPAPDSGDATPPGDDAPRR